MKQTLSKTFWRLLPKKSMSRLMGRIARHPISRHLIPPYIRLFEIDMSPVKRQVHEFENLLDFFVRELVPEARPIEGDESVVVSPVDGTVSQGGKIEAGTLIQAKGVTYSLDQLLSYQRAFVEKFDGGEFVTIYLSPRDYHRIHMPINGQIEASTYIPGELYPVNKTGVKRIPELFAINERVITYIRTSFGHMALIKVGATNVGSIKVVYDESIVTNPDKKLMRTHKEYQPPSSLAKGEEIGRFEFGSTVILLFEPGQIDWIIPLIPGTKVKMGQAIATVIKEKAGERNV